MNYYAIGFGVIACAALGAIDYANQASAAGQAPGAFSAGAYLDTLGARIGVTAADGTPVGDASVMAAARSGAASAPSVPKAAGGVTAVSASSEPGGRPEKTRPQRLTLSGGRSCLEGSGGHFCDD